MVDHDITARARYLDESAHLLASTSPAISRHLRYRLHTLATDHNLSLSDAQNREACGACGNIMIPGWTSRTYLDSGRSKRSLKRNASRKTRTGNFSSKEQTEEAAVKAVCYECLICNRVSRQPLPASSKASSKEQEHIPSLKSAAPASSNPHRTHIAAESGLAPPMSSFSNVSSRKRAKARKQSGLQALLAKRKEESLGGGVSTGFGLDLMDLMKTG